MNAISQAPRTRNVRLVGVLALIWNLIGVAMFWMQINMGTEQLAVLSEPERAVYQATPVWVNIAFAIGVFGGVLGAIGLLVRKRWAVTMFFVSLLALLVQMVGAYVVTPAWSAFGIGGLVMPVIVIVVAVLLWSWSQRAAERGALN